MIKMLHGPVLRIVHCRLLITIYRKLYERTRPDKDNKVICYHAYLEVLYLGGWVAGGQVIPVRPRALLWSVVVKVWVRVAESYVHHLCYHGDSYVCDDVTWL